MNILRKFALSLVLPCTLTAAAAAQETGTGSSPSAGAALHLNVVVTPKSNDGAPVAELPQSVFTVFDNGQPQALQSFHAVAGSTDPVKVFLVVDDINIDYTRLAFEREQIEKFLKTRDGQLAQPTSLGLVTDTSTEATPGFTTNGLLLSQTLEKKVIGLRDLRRSSGVYGAEERLDLSLSALQKLIGNAATVPGRKAIVWISPGWPLLSGPAIQLSAKEENSIFRQIMGLSTALRQANVTLYSVDPLGAAEGLNRTFYYEQFVKPVRKVSQAQLGNLGLQVLAVQSGGLALSSSNDIAGLLTRCADNMKASYELVYEPPPSDAPQEYHEIQVKVAGPGLVARTRQGYYAQP